MEALPLSLPFDDAGPKPFWTGQRVLLGVFALGLGTLLLMGALFLAASTNMRHSTYTKRAVRAASQDARVVAVTGLPLRVGLLVSGSMPPCCDRGEAVVKVPVSGPLGKGTVYGVFRESFSGPRVTTLEFWPAKDPNAIVRIVEPGSESGTH